jgi:hypothetical protein
MRSAQWSAGDSQAREISPASDVCRNRAPINCWKILLQVLKEAQEASRVARFEELDCDSELRTTMLESFRSLRKRCGAFCPLVTGAWIILAPRRQKCQVRNLYLCGPFDFAQNVLCAFARDIATFAAPPRYVICAKLYSFCCSVATGWLRFVRECVESVCAKAGIFHHLNTFQ